MKTQEVDKGVEIDSEKFLAWSKNRNPTDVGALMKLLCEAIENDDDKFLRRFDWIGKKIQRPKVAP